MLIFQKNTDFDNKLKNINKEIIPNKVKHLLVNNELNELSEKVELISRKGLTEDLTSKNSILNGEKYFSREYALQNYLTFQPVLGYFIPATNDMVMVWKSKGLSEKVLNLLLQPAIVLFQH